MNKLDKYINKLSKIKYNISHPKYDIYSKKIGYYMTGGAITNSQLMSLIVMYLLIQNSSGDEGDEKYVDDETGAPVKKYKFKEAVERMMKKKKESTSTESAKPAEPAEPTTEKEKRPRTTPEEDKINEKINALFKHFDKEIILNNVEKNTVNSKKNAVKRLLKSNQQMRNQIGFEDFNIYDVPQSKLLALKTLLLTENIQTVKDTTIDKLKEAAPTINKAEAKEYVDEKKRKQREEENRILRINLARNNERERQQRRYNPQEEWERDARNG